MDKINPAILVVIVSSLLSSPIYANECIPTPHRTTGTHYEPVTEQKVNIGQGVLVRGQVLGMPDCDPVGQAKVAHWQAGEDGRYRDDLRAYLYTDQEGRFQFETEWPKLSPPHIHFIVTAEGYEVLETQWIGRERQDNIDFKMVLESKQVSIDDLFLIPVQLR